MASRAAPSLGGKLTQPDLLSLLCCECDFPITEPARQTSCGCRLCSGCFSVLLERKDSHSVFYCRRCEHYVPLDDTFKDRAVQNELKRALFPCFNPSCPWIGSNTNYRGHVLACRYSVLSCPHLGCKEKLLKDEMSDHIASCVYSPSLCQFCAAKIPGFQLENHYANDCPEYIILCTSGCGCKVLRKEIEEHLSSSCPLLVRPCRYTKYGCHHKDNIDGLMKHYKNDAGYHLGLFEKDVKDCISKAETPQEIRQKLVEETERRVLETTRAELTVERNEMDRRLAPVCDGLLKAEIKLSELQDSFAELSLLFQTLQATSYNGQFVWKIPEVDRRRHEAKTGKTVSLYSAPFYTGRFGYKLCLRLYLNGDGSGKNTHISFFLTIMRGEYDALLLWPFSQMATLMLLDQSGSGKHVVQCFKPEPSSSSFWQPKSEMNVASGCPRFAPISVLNDQSYVKDDVMFLKTMIDATNLTQP